MANFMRKEANTRNKEQETNQHFKADRQLISQKPGRAVDKASKTSLPACLSAYTLGELPPIALSGGSDCVPQASADA